MDRALAILAFCGFVLVGVGARHLAARRVNAGRTGFTWLLFPGQIAGAGALILSGVVLVGSAPAAGAGLIVVGAISALLLARLVSRVQKSVGRPEAIDIQIDAASEYVLSAIGIMLLAAVGLAVGLVLWGLLSGHG